MILKQLVSVRFFNKSNFFALFSNLFCTRKSAISFDLLNKTELHSIHDRDFCTLEHFLHPVASWYILIHPVTSCYILLHTFQLIKLVLIIVKTTNPYRPHTYNSEKWKKYEIRFTGKTSVFRRDFQTSNTRSTSKNCPFFKCSSVLQNKL